MSNKEPKLRGRGFKRITTAVLFLLLLAVASAGYWFFFLRGVVSTDDARIDGDLVDLAPQIGGLMKDLRVQEGALVKKGQVLFVLDQSGPKAALAKAEGAVATARAALDVAQAMYEKSLHGARPEEISFARAAEQKAKQAMDLAESEWKRIRSLFQNGVVSASERDRARTAFDEALKAHEQSLNTLAILEQGTRSEDLASAAASVEAAKAGLATAEASAQQAQVSLNDTEVRAPFDGVVVRKWLNPGEMISPGRTVLTLFNPATLHVSANVEEKSLKLIAPGDAVDIVVDAYPNLTLKGRVTNILPVTNSQFSLIPSEGVSGTFIKVSQRLPILIALDRPKGLTLGPGMSVEIKIHLNKDPKAEAKSVAAE